MKTEIQMQPRSSLEAFADEHGLTMIVHERDSSFKHRFYAMFKDAEVKEKWFLIGTHGNGATADAAIRDYAAQISEKTIVVNAMRADRKEISVPILEVAP